jgi:hypothetical protein
MLSRTPNALPLTLLVSALVWPARASAAPNFPRNIKAAPPEGLGLNYTPPCSICHQFGKTGNGTPIEPFAWSMRARGLTGSRGTLTPALDLDEKDGVDSDGDGIPDIIELRNGTDPNSPANDCIIPEGTPTDAGQCTPGTQASPSLGCATRPDHERAGAAGGLGFLGLLLGIAAVRRRCAPR